jgi:hypothetical protein
MRAREFLVKEAHVFKTQGNQYVPGYRMSISTKSGGASINAVSSVVNGFDPREELTIVTPDTPATYIVPLSKDRSVSFKLKRANNEVIELQGTRSAIESSLNGIGAPLNPNEPGKVVAPNKGDTAEALLGGAMFAKLLKRTGNVIGSVTNDDVWNIFDKMKPVEGDNYQVTAKDLGGAVDTIWFKLKVKNTVRMALGNPELRKKLNNWLSSPVNYVNSQEGTDYAEEFYKNGQPDEIGVISDGLSAQSEKKTDVYTVVRDPKTGGIKKELLPISLKAGADQFAQHSGSNINAMKEMFKHLGITIPPDVQQGYIDLQQQGQQTKAAEQVYNYVAGIIDTQVETPTQEAAFVQKLSEALKFWATNNDDNVRVVSFGGRGDYEVLRFDNLLPIMKKLVFVAEVLPGENPKLVIKDQITGKILFHIRTYLQAKEGGKYQRNVIEKGPLLGIIADSTSRHSAEVQNLPNVRPARIKNTPAAVGTVPVDTTPKSIQNMKKPLGASQQMMGAEPTP